MVAAAAATPLIAAVGVRAGLVDRPGELKIHLRPIPVTGGIAVAAAVVLSSVFVGGMTLGVLAAVVVALGLGVVDDARPLPAWIRVAGQALAGCLLVASGLSIEPFEIAGQVVVVVLVVACCNATNMADGQDGLATGVGAIAALGIATVSARASLPASLPLATAGALLGFLAWNRPPARVFLGDGGAYGVGVLLAASAAQASADGWAGLLAAGACLGVFAYELCASILRRARSGRSPVSGDRDHLYDRLAHALGSRPRSTAVMWGLGVVSAAIGVSIGRLGAVLGAWLVAATLVITSIAETRFLPMTSTKEV